MFTILAFLLAFLTTAFGIVCIITIFSIVGVLEATTRYLGTTDLGAAIDSGIYYALIAIGLGTIAEISRSLKNLSAVEYE